MQQHDIETLHHKKRFVELQWIYLLLHYKCLKDKALQKG